MANSLFQQIGANQVMNKNPGAPIEVLKRMMKMLKGQSNPMQVIQMLASQNPQVAQVMDMINSSGMPPKQIFMKMAHQCGVDPNNIINMLK